MGVLTLNNFSVHADHKVLIQPISYTFQPGRCYFLVGPNGIGKSTFAHALMGFKKTQGSICLDHVDLTDRSPTQRSLAGLFLGFQQPAVFKEVSGIALLTKIMQKRFPTKDLPSIINSLKEKTQLLGIAWSRMERGFNYNCSGGERKLNELLQAIILEPKVAILDEIDAGLDQTSLSVYLNYLNTSTATKIIITHNHELLGLVDNYELLSLKPKGFIETSSQG